MMAYLLKILYIIVLFFDVASAIFFSFRMTQFSCSRIPDCVSALVMTMNVFFLCKLVG